MALFQDIEAAQRIEKRLQELAPVDLAPLWQSGFAGCPDPDLALNNLERWLAATSNPGTYLMGLAQLPRVGALFLNLLGSSQPLADSLVQNPELASLVTEPDLLGRIPKAATILDEGRVLLQAATSYSHALDRLRYLRQKSLITVVLNDLAGNWEQEVVWQALSSIADGIIGLTAEAVWKEFCQQKQIDRPLPVMVVAFGKLGGDELNYSSDVDLVFVSEDGVDEAVGGLSRYCEMLTRALTDPMGRGSLYRVDLRLRPFGGAGAMAPSMRTVEAYYKLHSQLWEVQAMIRSQPIGGPAGLQERWRALVEQTCFRPKVSELALEEVVQIRRRTEEGASPEDIKRGAGGIRDVEFLTQILQLVHGIDHEELRVRPTCQALRALSDTGVLGSEVARSLIEGYTFLRKLEHRLQLVADQQTHHLPHKEAHRHHVALLMGNRSWDELWTQIARTRAQMRQHYDRLLTPTQVLPKEDLLNQLGPLAGPIQQWFDSLPESEAFYGSLVENQGSLDRVCRIILHAPLLPGELKRSLSLTEAVVSGEIDEEPECDPVSALPRDRSLDLLGKAYQTARTRLLTRWALGPHFDLGRSLAELMDSLLRQAVSRLHAEFDLVALGSYGVSDMSVASDGDILLLVRDQQRQMVAESQAQQFLALLNHLRRFDTTLSVDLRLRPEGGKGLLVRTYQGLRAYELEAMEMWERFALGQCRLVQGSSAAIDVVMHCAYALPVTPERLKDLVAMKKRVETERVAPQHWKRDVKLGYGGLSDIEWFVHLNEMRFPTATQPEPGTSFESRLRQLFRARLVNSLELDELLQARGHLTRTRHRLALLCFEDDVLPENPDKLDRLASTAGYRDGHAFLAYHNRVIDTVRTIYTEGLDRLKA